MRMCLSCCHVTTDCDRGRKILSYRPSSLIWSNELTTVHCWDIISLMVISSLLNTASEHICSVLSTEFCIFFDGQIFTRTKIINDELNDFTLELRGCRSFGHEGIWRCFLFAAQ